MPYSIARDEADFGAHLRGWRMVLGLTAAQVCERAGISPKTLRDLERGAGTASLHKAMQVARALGQLDSIIQAIDPLNTDIGRARAGQITRRRV